MAVLEIKKFGCPTLKEKSLDVELVDDDTRSLIDRMFETMYAAEGIGLAAPQVGVSRRVVVLDVRPSDPSRVPLALVNPRIVEATGEIVGEEGCLSIPAVAGDVKRASDIRVEFLDRDGSPATVSASGIEARALQHEIDHLDGVLVIERFSAIRRNLLRSQLRKIRKEGQRQASGPIEVTEPVAESPS